MKKFVIFLIAVIVVICGVSYLYLNYKADYNVSKKANLEFENYLNKEVYGTDLSTVINKAIDNNEKNDVQKNDRGFYLDNKKNSISIEIKITDDDSIYKMETFYNGGMQNFLNYYGNIKFRCINIKYHENTNKVKYMLFQQMTN